MFTIDTRALPPVITEPEQGDTSNDGAGPGSASNSRLLRLAETGGPPRAVVVVASLLSAGGAALLPMRRRRKTRG